MRLLRLLVENFKGIDLFEFRPMGHDVVISGRNGTGKTTVADAYAWVVTGKGLDGKTIETQIKRRGADGQTPEDGGVVHAVEAELEFDGGREMVLRREYAEKWTKKRGAAQKEFNGNTINYIIDGVPMTKKAFENRISGIISEDGWRLLSMPLHFCNLKWQDRRKMLLEICGGDVSDESVIGSLPELEPLSRLMEGRSVEDFRKVLKSKIAKVNDELKTIPARIDEVQQMAGDDDGEMEKTKLKLQTLSERKAQAEQRLFRLEQTGGKADIQSEVVKLEAEAAKRKMELDADYLKKDSEYATKSAKLDAEQIRNIEALEAAKRKIAQLQRCIETNEAQCEELYAEYDRIDAESPEVADTCPYCGQILPAEKAGQARAEFNAKKSERLTDIIVKGKAIRESQAKDKAAIERLQETASAAEDSIKKAAEALTALLEAKEKLAKPDVSQDAKCCEIQARIAELKQKLAEPSDVSDEAQKLRDEIEAIDTVIKTKNARISEIQQQLKARDRIADLKARESELGAMYGDLESQLYLTELFMRQKVSLTEDEVNSHFNVVRWKMFDQKINGALEECCEPLIDGVPYSDGLNKGSRMRAALDILRALTKHYGMTFPVWIDDAESYTSESIPSIESQLILLTAVEGVEELTVTIAEPKSRKSAA